MDDFAKAPTDSTVKIFTYVFQKMGDPTEPPNELVIKAKDKCKNFGFNKQSIQMPKVFKNLLHFHEEVSIEYHVASIYFFFLRLFFVTYFLEEAEKLRLKEERTNVYLINDDDDDVTKRKKVGDEDYELVAMEDDQIENITGGGGDVLFNPASYRVEFNKLLLNYRRNVMKILQNTNVDERQKNHLRETEIFFIKAFILYNSVESKRIFDDEITNLMKRDWSDMCSEYKKC